MLRVATAVMLIFAITAPAGAKQVYAAYDGPDAVKVGAGGTKMIKNEIEYWTSGAPARPFQVLGIFTDARKNRWWDGDALGSGSIARKAKEAGGDAVIVLDADTKFVGIASYFSSSGSFGGSVSPMGNFSGSTQSSGFGTSEVINRTTTRLLVIRYLNDSEVAALRAQPTNSSSILPSPIAPVASAAVRSGQAGDQQIGPPKRTAKTPSGYCYEVPRGYAGTGSLSRPALTDRTPACYELLER